MTRRATVIASLLALLLNALIPIAAAAVDSAPSPTSMAAVGDSITQAASSDGDLGVDAPRNSWSTGTNSTVMSHALRLGLTGSAANLSVSGAKVAHLDGQMQNVVSLSPDPGYLTVLIGGNDLCTDTIDEMTPVAEFRAAFQVAMSTVTQGSPDTYVYVVSIPDVHQLWELFRNNFFARAVWSAGNICQSLLANPTSNQQSDVERRAAFRQRNIDFNTALAEVCTAFAARCHYDGNAVFNTRFERGDVSGDYFHPSIQGQAKLAAVSWTAGYAFGEVAPQPNQPPTASFTASCAHMECTFADASTDADGSVRGWSWAFGDGAVSAAQNPTHTYQANGEYTVTLTVTDDDGATSAPASVTVRVPAATTVHIHALAGSSATSGRNSWTATVIITVADDTGAVRSGATVTGTWSTGGSTTCTTGTDGTCSVSTSLNAKRDSATTWTVGGITHPSLTYAPGDNTVSSLTIARP